MADQTQETIIAAGDKTENAENAAAEKGKIPALRTFKLDASDYVNKRKLSMVDIVAENTAAARTGLTEEKVPTPMFTKILYGLISLLVIGVGVGLWFYLAPKIQPVEQVVIYKTIIPADVTTKIDFEPKSTLSERIGKSVGEGAFNQFANLAVIKGGGSGTADDLASLQEIFDATGVRLPAGLSDFSGRKYMLAKFYMSQDWPILIVDVPSYERAFSGMIGWEENILEQMKNLFGLNVNIQDSFLQKFADKEIKGHDTRILVDKNNKTALIYSFVNRKYLVITTGQEPLEEVFKRFNLP